MRITASVMGILLIAAAAVAQDDGNAVASASQNGEVSAESVAQNGTNAAPAGAIIMDDAAIDEKVKDLQKHVFIAAFSDRTATGKQGGRNKTVRIDTEQDKDDPFVGTLRLTVEMLDGTNMWYGQQQVKQVKQKLLSSAEKKAEQKAKAERKKSKGKKKGAKGKKAEAVETKGEETAAAGETEVAGEKKEASETESVETEAVETEAAGAKAPGAKAARAKAAEKEPLQLKPSEIDYTGEDVWKLMIKVGKDGELLKPETKAYAVEYGFIVNRKAADGTVVSNQFIVVASKYNKVASADEIMARNRDSKVLKAKMTGKALREGEGEGDEGGGGDGEGGGGGGGRNR